MVAVVVPLSIVHPVVISRKLSKIERPMANVEVDIADYIVASRSILLQTLPWGDLRVSHTKYVQYSLLFEAITAVVNRADSRLNAGVANCSKRSATLGTCC